MKLKNKVFAIVIVIALAGMVLIMGCGKSNDLEENSQQESSQLESSLQLNSKQEGVNGESSSSNSSNKNNGTGQNNSSSSNSSKNDNKNGSSSSSNSNAGNSNNNSSGNMVISPRPDGSKVNPSYLDDAVFVGDSVSLKLKYYVSKIKKSNSSYFGDAQFLAAGSLGSANALWDVGSNSVHPSYQGQKMKVEDAIVKMGAKKVYIMLGMNDIGLYGIDQSVANMKTLLGKIKEKSPNAEIIVQSVTPMVKSAQLSKLNNANISKYNDKIKDLCSEKGYNYLDVASVMADPEGNLPLKYCSDPDGLGLHFTDAACEEWVNYILRHPIS